MDKDHELIVSAQMLAIIDKHERDTIFGKAGLPVAIKNHLKSHGWMDKKEVENIQTELSNLKRELEEVKRINSGTLYCLNCGLAQLGLGASCCKTDGEPSMTITEIIKELTVERTRADKLQKELDALKIAHEQAGIEAFKVTMAHKDRADLNERALRIASAICTSDQDPNFIYTPDYFRKLAEKEIK